MTFIEQLDDIFKNMSTVLATGSVFSVGFLPFRMEFKTLNPQHNVQQCISSAAPSAITSLSLIDLPYKDYDTEKCNAFLMCSEIFMGKKFDINNVNIKSFNSTENILSMNSLEKFFNSFCIRRHSPSIQVSSASLLLDLSDNINQYPLSWQKTFKSTILEFKRRSMIPFNSYHLGQSVFKDSSFLKEIVWQRFHEYRNFNGIHDELTKKWIRAIERDKLLIASSNMITENLQSPKKAL